MLYIYLEMDFQQNNIKEHSVNFIIKVFKVYKIELIKWPINSFNFNFIEIVQN